MEWRRGPSQFEHTDSGYWMVWTFFLLQVELKLSPFVSYLLRSVVHPLCNGYVKKMVVLQTSMPDLAVQIARSHMTFGRWMGRSCNTLWDLAKRNLSGANRPFFSPFLGLTQPLLNVQVYSNAATIGVLTYANKRAHWQQQHSFPLVHPTLSMAEQTIAARFHPPPPPTRRT